MNTRLEVSIKTFMLTIILLFIGFVLCYFINYYHIYKSIKVVVSELAIVEYGSKKYDINRLIDSKIGDIVSIKRDIDTNKVGFQEVLIEVKKNNIIKDVSIIVEVKDTIAPEVKFKEPYITLIEGDSFDASSNLESVFDKVDGSLDYRVKELGNKDINNYYTIDSNVNSSVPGNYSVVIKARDRYGNLSTGTYQVEVKEEQKQIELPQVVVPVYQNEHVAVGNMNQLVQVAYSLLGSPYAVGGTMPTGFDCSGFVQYVFSQIGISVSRSSTTQMQDGVSISYDGAQPGDILCWGYVNGVATHSAIYVGNGQMIHSTNPKQGVILSDVATWTRGSGTRLIAVRRI